MGRRISNVIGFDDAPFERSHRGDVMLIGAVFSGTRLDGILASRVRRDGANATARMADMVRCSSLPATFAPCSCRALLSRASTWSICAP